MRNNLERLGLDTKSPQDDNGAVTSALNFVVPTEIVDLPSKGLYYTEGHPLHGKDTIEIRFMTAKDEDTLTNISLLKKGVALEKVLQDIIIDKSIRSEQLLVGDKNAIIVAARKSAYGSDYQTKITCPSCGKVQEYEFDLNSLDIKNPLSDEELDQLNIVKTDNCTFMFNLPILKVPVELRLMTGRDENFIAQRTREAQQLKKDLDSLTLQLSVMMKSINGKEDRQIINEASALLPAKDSRTIREVYKTISPNVDLSHDFECKSCSYETRLEVPFTSDFFWPK
jgi:hypothetical protein